MTHTFSTTEEIRLSALRYAEVVASYRTATHNGVAVQAETTAEDLVKDAKIIEAYILSDSE